LAPQLTPILPLTGAIENCFAGTSGSRAQTVEEQAIRSGDAFIYFPLAAGEGESRRGLTVIARSERDEAIQDGISDWIASLALAMTSRSRGAA
jgi:hypothetical protein